MRIFASADEWWNLVDDSPGLRQVRDWRHKLQKAFLGAKDGQTFPIKAEVSTVSKPAWYTLLNIRLSQDMPKCNEYFDAMEAFDMNKDWLQVRHDISQAWDKILY